MESELDGLEPTVEEIKVAEKDAALGMVHENNDKDSSDELLFSVARELQWL